VCGGGKDTPDASTAEESLLFECSADLLLSTAVRQIVAGLIAEGQKRCPTFSGIPSTDVQSRRNATIIRPHRARVRQSCVDTDPDCCTTANLRLDLLSLPSALGSVDCRFGETWRARPPRASSRPARRSVDSPWQVPSHARVENRYPARSSRRGHGCEVGSRVGVRLSGTAVHPSDPTSPAQFPGGASGG